MIEPVVTQLRVPRPPAEAFDLFTNHLATWWPAEYTWAQEALEELAIEPRSGGFCYEVGPYGFRCDWGRVTECVPPERLVFSWQISPGRAPVPDPAKASVVEAAFAAEDGRAATRVAVEHREFDRHGDGAAAYRDAMASEFGWPFILGQFARVAAG